VRPGIDRVVPQTTHCRVRSTRRALSEISYIGGPDFISDDPPLAAPVCIAPPAAYPVSMRLLPLLALFTLPVHAADYLVLVGPGQTFNPAELTIAAGDRVTFRNSGGTHNVKANDNAFRCANGCDGDGQGGDGAAANNIWHFSRVFPTAATIGYYCETHGTPSNGMRGTLIVLPSTPVELQSFDVD